LEFVMQLCIHYERIARLSEKTNSSRQ
jgi:hypothetical protein